MTTPTPEAPRQHWVILFLATALAAILLTSLWHRFTNPSLTVNRFAQSQGSQQAASGNRMAGMENMTAIGQLMENVAQNPHDVPALLKLAESLMAVGQWGSAENFALKAMSEPGENPRAMYLLAVINHNQGKHGEAAELLEKLLAKEENPSARYSLAILDIHFLNKPEAGRLQLQKGLLTEGASPSLRSAMQEELAKLPPAPMERDEANQGETSETPAQPTPDMANGVQPEQNPMVEQPMENTDGKAEER